MRQGDKLYCIKDSYDDTQLVHKAGHYLLVT